MSDGSSPFEASQSALGYLQPCQYALMLGFQRDEEQNRCINIEKLADIALRENSRSAGVANNRYKRSTISTATIEMPCTEFEEDNRGKQTYEI